jgi:hypothetical protein
MNPDPATAFSLLSGTAVALALMAGAIPCVAQNIAMPAGARQWMCVSSSMVDNGDCCDEAVGGVGSIPYPSPNYVRYQPYRDSGGVYYANGDCTANRLRSSYYRGGAISALFFYNAMVDTYTISGPPGTEGTPVQAQLTFRATGRLHVGYWCCGVYVGGSWLVLEVGTWNDSTDPSFHEGSRVIAFDDANFTRRVGIDYGNHGATQPTLQFDTEIDQPITRTVGQPFDLAFGLNLSGDGAANITGTPAPVDYIVGVIDWELPEGYTITSTSGWTDPDAPQCGSADFDGDGDLGTDGDIEAFFACLGGSCCPSCGSVDFDADGDVGTDADLESFFRVLGGGPC